MDTIYEYIYIYIFQLYVTMPHNTSCSLLTLTLLETAKWKTARVPMESEISRVNSKLDKFFHGTVFKNRNNASEKPANAWMRHEVNCIVAAAGNRESRRRLERYNNRDVTVVSCPLCQVQSSS